MHSFTQNSLIHKPEHVDEPVSLLVYLFCSIQAMILKHFSDREEEFHLKKALFCFFLPNNNSQKLTHTHTANTHQCRHTPSPSGCQHRWWHWVMLEAKRTTLTSYTLTLSHTLSHAKIPNHKGLCNTFTYRSSDMFAQMFDLWEQKHAVADTHSF